MESFTRLLEQFVKGEQSKYDKAAVAKNDMFTAREQMAISANVESMRVQMGKGFVSKTCLDKQIQRLVAANGPRAMRMLERVCLISETIKGEVTLLTLFIVEGRDLKGWRSQHVAAAVATTGFTDPKYTSKYYEVLRHDDATNQVVADTRVTVHEGSTLVKEIKDTIPIKTLYPRVVETYRCSPKTDDLDDACKRMLDPLSYSHFLDLIRENNTLPAYLYTISQTQSPGLLFNAKEMLHVKSGGSDSTSVDYFRLFWKLAAKDANKCVKVPGTFANANVCLPIAPEPLTNTVLSCLMPGLLSEFITGTSMAPLPGIIDLYVGFLNLHMRGKHTGLDIARIGEILSTMRVWVDNPNTLPKPETFREIVDNLVKDQGVVPGVSSGKIMPVKAFAYLCRKNYMRRNDSLTRFRYALLDEVHPVPVKFSALYKETLKISDTYTKYFIVPSSELGKNPKLSEDVARNQTGLTEFFKELVGALAEDNQVVDDIPVSYLSAAHRLSSLVTSNNRKDVIEFLDNPRHAHAIGTAVWRALGEKTSVAYSGDVRSWCGTQRMFAVWLCAATYPIMTLCENFRNFQAPLAFEAHFAKTLRRVVGPDHSFDHVLFQWVVQRAGEEPGLMAIEFRNGTLHVRDTGFNSTPLFDCEVTIRREFLGKLWDMLHPILNMWYWKHRPGSAYNLLDLDYDLVKALRDSSLISSLSQVQCSELNAIREYKNPLYFKYIPPKPTAVELSREARFAASQAAKSVSGKSRISIIFIGSGNCGKSTIAGHMLYKRGIIDQRVLKQYQTASNHMGKSGVEFAWILNRLKHEREQGRSVETHAWCLESNQYEVDILDAPGHSDFIKNVAVLVVSAADGEFEAGITRGGMTREEALVAYATGIRRFIVVVTKMELKNYSASRFEEISLSVAALFKQIGISSQVPVIPVSGLIGDNLVEPSANISWYSSSPRTLLEALDSVEPPQRMYDGPVRVPILKTYKIGGVGTVAVGRVISGMLSKGDEVLLAPSNITAQVRSIEMYHTAREAALPGDVIAFNIKGVSVQEVPRGLVALPPGKYPRVSSFIALIAVIDHPTSIHVGYTPFVCIHTRTVTCKIVNIIERIEKQTGTVIEANPKSIKKGDAAHVELQPTADLYVEPVSKCPALARFIMRDGHGTVAIGVVKSVIDTATAPPKLPTGMMGKHASNKKR